jgi:hypothetical protein
MELFHSYGSACKIASPNCVQQNIYLIGNYYAQFLKSIDISEASLKHRANGCSCFFLFFFVYRTKMKRFYKAKVKLSPRLCNLLGPYSETCSKLGHSYYRKAVCPNLLTALPNVVFSSKFFNLYNLWVGKMLYVVKSWESPIRSLLKIDHTGFVCLQSCDRFLNTYGPWLFFFDLSSRADAMSARNHSYIRTRLFNFLNLMQFTGFPWHRRNKSTLPTVLQTALRHLVSIPAFGQRALLLSSVARWYIFVPKIKNWVN